MNTRGRANALLPTGLVMDLPTPPQKKTQKYTKNTLKTSIMKTSILFLFLLFTNFYLQAQCTYSSI